VTAASPIAARVLHPIGQRIARIVARTRATPELRDSCGTAGGARAGGMLAAGWNVAGGAAIVATAVLDAVDGELARLKGLTSRFGAVFDAVADRYTDAAILGGMTVYAARFEGWPQPRSGRLGALAGALTVAYAERASGITWRAARDGGDVVRRARCAARGGGRGGGLWPVLLGLAALGATSALAVAWRLTYLRVRRIGLEP